MALELSQELKDSVKKNGIAGAAKELCLGPQKRIAVSVNQMLDIASSFDDMIEEAATKGKSRISIESKTARFLQKSIEMYAENTIEGMVIIGECVDAMPAFVAMDIANNLKKKDALRQPS